ncbi:MAG: response regulator transcription factor [Chitinophagales bacterium]|nr:response regulator transcription factor [Chitinophagales bacterium]
MSDLKILIADDHPFFRDGIHQLLVGQSGIGEIGEAANGRDVLQQLSKKFYDLVIMDIKMPQMSGIEATREIHKKYPAIKVLAISMFDEQPYIVKMLKAGAKGYLLKNSTKDELLKAISQIMMGENYFSKEVSDIMVSQIVSGKPVENGYDDEPELTLTKREIEIIKMIAAELTNVDIGESLNISPRTVDTHRRNLLQKLKVRNTAGLVKYAIKNELLDQ